MINYGSLVGGDAFFASRLHNFDWVNATAGDQQKALVSATDLIDQFGYDDQKYPVSILDSDATDEEFRLADLSQELEFPRGSVNTVPTEIEHACYLIAQALLSGRDPEMDLESLAATSTAYGSVRTS